VFFAFAIFGTPVVFACCFILLALPQNQPAVYKKYRAAHSFIIITTLYDRQNPESIIADEKPNRKYFGRALGKSALRAGLPVT